jgi:hypothetical protein
MSLNSSVTPGVVVQNNVQGNLITDTVSCFTPSMVNHSSNPPSLFPPPINSQPHSSDSAAGSEACSGQSERKPSCKFHRRGTCTRNPCSFSHQNLPGAKKVVRRKKNKKRNHKLRSIPRPTEKENLRSVLNLFKARGYNHNTLLKVRFTASARPCQQPLCVGKELCTRWHTNTSYKQEIIRLYSILNRR